MSFSILVDIHYHNIHAWTPHKGYHRVTKVGYTTNVSKMGEKSTKCMGARPTPPHTTPIG